MEIQLTEPELEEILGTKITLEEAREEIHKKIRQHPDPHLINMLPVLGELIGLYERMLESGKTTEGEIRRIIQLFRELRGH